MFPLPCGHPTKEPCSSLVFPVRDYRCEYSCAHRKVCTHNCSQPCGFAHITNVQRNAMNCVIVPGVIIHALTPCNVNIHALEYAENLAHKFVGFAKSRIINSQICVLVILIQRMKLGIYS